jgi:hypothetical protein
MTPSAIPTTTTTATKTPTTFELIKPIDSLWVRRWWKWILEIPASKNPGYGYNFIETTTTPQPCDKEGVWFLAGAFNDGLLPHTRHVSLRTVKVSNNKALLLPVINFFGVVRKAQDIEQLNDRVKHEMDVINQASLYVTVDRQPVVVTDLIRADTGSAFPIEVDGKDNVVRLKHVFGRPIKLYAKGDGYWLFLKPLPPGKHEIHSFGSCLQGKIQIEVDYRLEVVGGGV